MDSIITLEPVFKNMLWGGRKLETEFGYDIPEGQVGECWAISAHPNGDCTIASGAYPLVALGRAPRALRQRRGRSVPAAHQDYRCG